MKKIAALFMAASLFALTAIATVSAQDVPTAVPAETAALPYGDHVVAGTPVPDKPGVTVVMKDKDALVTFCTRIPAADIRLVGDFQGWKPEKALPMFKVKNAAGKTVWYITLKVAPDAVLIYKYYVNGQWTEDAMAPVSVNDGYGGHNGKADVKALLAAK